MTDLQISEVKLRQKFFYFFLSARFSWIVATPTLATGSSLLLWSCLMSATNTVNITTFSHISIKVYSYHYFIPLIFCTYRNAFKGARVEGPVDLRGDVMVVIVEILQSSAFGFQRCHGLIEGKSQSPHRVVG